MNWRAPQTLAVVWPRATARPMTGAVELALAEAVEGSGRAQTRPERASTVIAASFDTVDGAATTPELVRALGSGVRAWLLCQAALMNGRDPGWYQAQCHDCGAAYDFQLSLDHMPRGTAGPGYPVVEIATSLGPRRFEAPNGSHEEALAQARNFADPRRDLVALLALAETALTDAGRYSEADLARIETILDEVTPDIADRISATCPECAAVTEAAIDPLSFAFPRAETLLREAHLIARAYGWREPSILALPSHRRRAYARLIASDMRGGTR